MDGSLVIDSGSLKIFLILAGIYALIPCVMWFFILTFRFVGACIWMFLVYIGFLLLALLVGGIINATSFLILFPVAALAWLGYKIVHIRTKFFLDHAKQRLPVKQKILSECTYIVKDAQENVLLLTASAGFGHLSAARAMSHKLRRESSRTSIYCLNVYDFMKPKSRFMSEHGFEYLSLYIPWLYGLLHKLFMLDMKWLVRRKASVIAKKVALYLENQGIAVSKVVCFHPLAPAVAKHLKEKLGFELIVVSTDFYLNPHCIHDDVNEYIRNTDAIDVRKLSVWQKRTRKTDLGFNPDRPLILVAMGGSGLIKGRSFVKLLYLLHATLRQNRCQFLLVTGLNYDFYELAKAIFYKTQDVQVRLKVDFDEYLACCDGIIGKAGGMTIAESVALNIPFAVWEAWPGPEKKNVKYLLTRGQGIYLKTKVRRAKKWLETLPAVSTAA